MTRSTPASRIARALTFPLDLADFQALLDPLASARQPRARIVAVTRETPHAVTLTLKPSSRWRPHRAGEWVSLGVEVNGVRHWRPFSFSSPEGDDPRVTVTDAGRISHHLVHRAAEGDILLVDGPQGDFTLPTQTTPTLLIGAGSGVTPIASLAGTLARRARAGSASDFKIVHLARSDADALLAAPLSASARVAGGSYLPWRSATQGRFDLTSPVALDALVPDWRTRLTFVCGPAALIADAEALWAAEAPGRLRLERFSQPRAAIGEGGTATFARSARTLDAPGAASLLEVAEGAGMAPKHGCRMGICRTCLCRLESGAVRNLNTGEMSDTPGEHVRICVSAAAGDVVLDA